MIQIICQKNPPGSWHGKDVISLAQEGAAEDHNNQHYQHRGEGYGHQQRLLSSGSKEELCQVKSGDVAKENY